MLCEDAQQVAGAPHSRGGGCVGHRWGRTRGKIGFHGGKVAVHRPRVRGLDGHEVAPWPAPEVLGTLPGSTDLLRAIMDFDLVGVQTERDADNLRRGLMQELGATPQKVDVLDAGRKSTRVRSFPIGIDVSNFQLVAARLPLNRIVSQTIAALGSPLGISSKKTTIRAAPINPAMTSAAIRATCLRSPMPPGE